MRYLFLISTLAVGLWLPDAQAGAASISAAVMSPASIPGVPASGRIESTVLRDGDPIGTDVREFVCDGDRLIVRTQTDIAVKVLYVTVYRFHGDVEEQWVDGHFVGLTTRANDDGTRKVVDLHSDSTAHVLQVSANGKAGTVPAGAMPSSFWNPASMQQTSFVDAMSGRSFEITAKPTGVETLQVGGHPVEAHRFAVRGGMNRDLWYSADGQLLKVEFDADDGSRISVVRKSM